jgi:hypothetical protein
LTARPAKATDGASMTDATFCLTLDIDWAHDRVIADTLALLRDHDTQATWFITHDTPLLAELRAAAGHELGVHPNFNPLLDGTSGQARDIVARLLDFVPGARAVRSHSLVRSSRLALLFAEMGFSHESNLLIPPDRVQRLAPWRDFGGLIQVPIRWEDDVRLVNPLLGEPVDYLGRVAPFVVDVHPIHVFLNTRTIDDYERARPHFRDFAALSQLRRPAGSGGTRDRLIALMTAAKAQHIPQARLSALLPGD